MARWYRVPIIGTFALDIDVAMPPDLRTLERMVVSQVRAHLDEQRARARADSRSRLGISVYQPLNGRPYAAQEHGARTRLLAQERQQLAEQEHLAVHDWRYYDAPQIEARVERAAERSVLALACEVAQHHGIGDLGRHRVSLQHAGHAAAESRWRQELADAWRRLKCGEMAAPSDDAAEIDCLRRQLDSVVRAAISAGEG